MTRAIKLRPLDLDLTRRWVVGFTARDSMCSGLLIATAVGSLDSPSVAPGGVSASRGLCDADLTLDDPTGRREYARSDIGRFERISEEDSFRSRAIRIVHELTVEPTPSSLRVSVGSEHP